MILYSYLLSSLTFTIVKNAQKWKVSLKTLMWSNTTLEEMRKILGLIILMGQVRTENKRDYCPLTPQFPHPFFLTLWVGTVLNPFGRPGMIVTTASKHRIQGSYSKFGLCVNIVYRNLGHYRAQNKNCRLMKPWSHGGVAWNLKFRTYNSGKITKYRVLVRMVCVRRYQVISATWRYTQLRGSVITFRQKFRSKS